MAFSIDTFTSKLKAGGALASLFEAELTTSKGPQQQSSIADFKFLCKSTTLPGDTIETATVTYMGRGINIPANRAAATWETTIYNDEGRVWKLETTLKAGWNNLILIRQI